MAAWQRLKVQQPVSPRVPDEKSQLTWLQREVHTLLGQLRTVLNWAVDWLGLAGVDATDTPGTLEAKVLGSASIVATKTGAVGARTLVLTVNPAVIPTGFPGFYEDDPEPVGIADPGDSALASHGDHSHAREPTPQITNVYYHDDAQSLVNPCPSAVSSFSFAFSNDTSETFANYATIVASPGIADWQGGVCNVVLRAKVANIVGTTHQVAVDLNRVSAAGVQVARYCNAVATWVGPTDILTGSIKVLRFQVPVRFLTGTATDRLRMTIYALPGLGGAVATESLYIETGADGATVLINDASQIQTLFGSSTGGPIEHSHTTGRDLADQHPWSAVTRPLMPAATVAADLVTVAATTDRARVLATVLVISGLCKTGFVDGQEMHLFVTNGTPASPVQLIAGAELSGSPTFAPFALEEVPAGMSRTVFLEGPVWCKFWYDADAALWRQAGKIITYETPS